MQNILMCNNTVWLPRRDSSPHRWQERPPGGPQVGPRAAMASDVSKAPFLALLPVRPKTNSIVILENFWKDTPKILVLIPSRR